MDRVNSAASHTRYSVMRLFLLIILAHLFEHLAQIYQLWILHWLRPDCLGLLGLSFPWLMRSEWLHYGYALFHLLGLWYFIGYFHSLKAYFYWRIAFIFQVFHHYEHFILLLQKLFKTNLFNSPVPISLGQLFIPRIELHLVYNLIVFIPMIIALYYQYVSWKSLTGEKHLNLSSNK